MLAETTSTEFRYNCVVRHDLKISLWFPVAAEIKAGKYLRGLKKNVKNQV